MTSYDVIYVIFTSRHVIGGWKDIHSIHKPHFPICS